MNVTLAVWLVRLCSLGVVINKCGELIRILLVKKYCDTQSQPLRTSKLQLLREGGEHSNSEANLYPRVKT